MYIDPKTDWTEEYEPSIQDLNRIEGNIKHIKSEAGFFDGDKTFNDDLTIVGSNLGLGGETVKINTSGLIEKSINSEVLNGIYDSSDVSYPTPGPTKGQVYTFLNSFVGSTIGKKIPLGSSVGGYDRNLSGVVAVFSLVFSYVERISATQIDIIGKTTILSANPTGPIPHSVGRGAISTIDGSSSLIFTGSPISMQFIILTMV